MTPLNVYEAGLCSAIPTIMRQCEYDSISRSGICYEDSCCTSVETATSWHYRLAQASHVGFSACGIVLLFWYVLKLSSKHMLPANVRVLVNIMLLLMLTHSVDMIIFHIYHIVQSFRIPPDNPCFVREKVSFCAPFRYTFSFCTMTLGICTYCIYIDRLACALYKNYARHQKWILALLLVKLTVISVSLVLWVYRKEDPDAYVLSCINVPPNSARDMALATAVILPVNIVCFFLSIVLFRVFKKRVKGSRFDITLHFTAAVDVESSEFLYYTTGAQAALMTLFSVCSLAMRFFYYKLPRPIAITVATLSYIFSINSVIIPWVMMRFAKSSSVQRKSRISGHVAMKTMGMEGADHYFGMMKSQWEV
uniref:Uncharacterized protein n=1 Tax=Caenorhabditis japonica TaxID=281687 RepID=A0A8R1HID8_CAEJA